MKACESCSRIQINKPYRKISKLRAFVGLIFVYLPIIFLPFILIAAALIYIHLRLMGAQNLKTLKDYLPERSTHRYSYKTQITYKNAPRLAFWARTKTFWLFNCTWYCPFSVGTLEWFTYLVKTVENWWCPFNHARKDEYANASIDVSYWHNTANLDQLHPDDRTNPIFSDQSSGKD